MLAGESVLKSGASCFCEVSRGAADGADSDRRDPF
jgi:hypothetical protein